VETLAVEEGQEVEVEIEGGKDLKIEREEKVGKIENNVPKVTRDVDAGGKDVN